MKKNILVLIPFFLMSPAIADDNNKEIHIGNTATKEKIVQILSQFQPPPEEGNSEPSGNEEPQKVSCQRLPKISINVNFPFDSSYLTRNEIKKTYEFADALKDSRWKHCIITVEGHTDSKGKSRYNKWLSERRAKSVSTQLYQRGVDKKRLKVVGYGEEHLLDLVNHESPTNRRVAFDLSD